MLEDIHPITARGLFKDMIDILYSEDFLGTMSSKCALICMVPGSDC
jgi:hypothetical protein